MATVSSDLLFHVSWILDHGEMTSLKKREREREKRKKKERKIKPPLSLFFVLRFPLGLIHHRVGCCLCSVSLWLSLQCHNKIWSLQLLFHLFSRKRTTKGSWGGGRETLPNNFNLNNYCLRIKLKRVGNFNTH